MERILQIHDISKEEFIEIIENIIDIKIEKHFKQNVKEKLTIEEVAKELNVAKLTVRNYISKGFIPASKLGRRIFIKRTDLDNALKEVKSLKYKR